MRGRRFKIIFLIFNLWLWFLFFPRSELGTKVCFFSNSVFAQIESIPKISTDYLFNFADYGDSQTNNIYHQDLVSQIVRLNPDFVLHTGDFVEDGSLIDEWNRFKEITSPLTGRLKKNGLSRNFYPAIGNHDFPLDNYFSIFNLDPTSDYYQAYYYSFDYKGYHFVSLNSEGNFSIGSSQYSWLALDLKKAKDKIIIIFFHKPAYNSGHFGSNHEIQDSLVPLFEEYNTKIVFSGHEHLYERSYPILGNEINNTNGITYIISGGGGGELSDFFSGNWWTAKIAKKYNFVFLQILYNKILGWTIDELGNIFDSFEIQNQKAKKKIMTAAGKSGSPHLRQFYTNGKLSDNDFFAYSKKFKGGTRIAAGDFDLDGKDEIVVGAGQGGSPHVRIFETDGTLLSQFFAFEKKYKGGLDVAAGDADGDGKDEIGVSKFSGKTPEVKIFRYNKDKTILFERNVFPKSKSGATITFGDIDGDGKAELVAGAGVGKKAQIKIFKIVVGNYEGEFLPITYLPFGKKFKNGLDVAAGDVDGDGQAEIAISKLTNSLSEIKVFEYNNEKTLLSKFRAFPKKYKTGVNIEIFDTNFDGKEEIITSQGPAEIKIVGKNKIYSLSKPQIRIFDYQGQTQGKAFLAYDKNFKGGAVAIGVNE